MAGIWLLSQAASQSSRVEHDQLRGTSTPFPSVLMIDADARCYTFAQKKEATADVTLRTEEDDAEFECGR
jgi:hypothetical protein